MSAIDPAHYKAIPGIECIDVVEHMNFNLGNVIKYVWRAGLKGDAQEDLNKAAWYLNREVERLGVDRPALADQLEDEDDVDAGTEYGQAIVEGLKERTEPRVFTKTRGWTYPEPPATAQVVDADGTEWKWDGTTRLPWRAQDGTRVNRAWRTLVEDYGPLTVVLDVS